MATSLNIIGKSGLGQNSRLRVCSKFKMQHYDDPHSISFGAMSKLKTGREYAQTSPKNVQTREAFANPVKEVAEYFRNVDELISGTNPSKLN